MSAYLANYPQAAALLWDRVPSDRIRDLTDGDAIHLALACACSREPFSDSVSDWTSMDVKELIEQIVRHHHPFLFAEMGRLRVLMGHLGLSLRQAVDEWASLLGTHMDAEEEELFPLCLVMDEVEPKLVAAIADPSRALHDLYVAHEDHQSHIDGIRTLLGAIPADQQVLPVIHAVLDGIAADLAVHTDIEREFILPAVHFAIEVSSVRQRRQVQSRPI